MEPTHPTNKLGSIREEEDLLSEADTLMGGEKQWSTPELESGKPSRKHTSMNSIISWWRVLDVFLMLIIFSLLFTMHEQRKVISASWQVGRDFTGAGPHCMFAASWDRGHLVAEGLMVNSSHACGEI